MNFIIEDSSLDKESLIKNESIFHTANGYIGVRGNFEEGYDNGYITIRGTYINAFYETHAIVYGEKLCGFPEEKQSIVNLIDAQTVELFIDDERFSLFSGEIIEYKRSFNLREGYTERKVLWKSPKGKICDIQIKRMTSFVNSELFLINYHVTPMNFSGNISVISRIDGDVQNYSSEDDPRVASDNTRILDVKDKVYSDGTASISAVTHKSGLTAACSVIHASIDSFTERAEMDEKSIDVHMDFKCEEGKETSFSKFCVYTDSLRHESPFNNSIDICRELASKNAEYYFETQKKYLEDFWLRSGVTIGENEGIQQGINYSIYQLLQSAGRDRFSNIGAKGLSGEGYEGHYFWDTEVYMLPFFMLTQPEMAKNLLLYRYNILDKARERAREMGHKNGALFPWRTITGGECSSFFPAGTAQYHINADIAYSYIMYWRLTEDIHFIEKYGAEVLFETARLWLDTGHYKDGVFCIDGVTGPDEYTCIVNNNYYTNAMAKHNLKWAWKFYMILKERGTSALKDLERLIGISGDEAEEFRKASECMYLPYNSELDINPQDDSFLNKAVWDFDSVSKDRYPLLLNFHPLTLYRYQVCKQADTVLAHYLLEEEQEASTIKNSFDYYERITTHDSSLSSCIFSIMAAKTGYPDKAYSYFLESARLDLDDTHGNTKDGIHTANMGGTYLSIVFGFAGLRIKDDFIYFRPILPEEWKGYSFRINYRGSIILIYIGKSYTEFILEEGNGALLFLEGEGAFCLNKECAKAAFVR